MKEFFFPLYNVDILKKITLIRKMRNKGSSSGGLDLLAVGQEVVHSSTFSTRLGNLLHDVLTQLETTQK